MDIADHGSTAAANIASPVFSGIGPRSRGASAANDPAERASSSAATSRLAISAFHQVWLAAALMGADLLLIVAAALAVVPVSPGREWVAVLTTFCTAACLQSAGKAVGLYDVRTPARIWRGCAMAPSVALLCIMLATLIALQLSGAALAERAAGVGGVAVLAIMLLRLPLAIWVEANAARLVERVVLVGTGSAVSRLLSGDSPADHRLVGWIAVRGGQPAPCEPLVTFGGDDAAVADATRIGEVLRERTAKIDRVVIAAADLDERATIAALQRIEHLPFEISLIPPGAALSEAKDPLDRSNSVLLRRAAMTQWGAVGKRALDIVAAALLLLLFAPLMLTVAALIRIGSPGPALFRQTRWGLNNAPFTVFKFRSMWTNAAATDGSVQATRGDTRITPFGAFLRKSSIDELPQLLNVLNGTMSLVGPRPHPVELNRRYLGVIERYAGRHRVMPGITGLAQVRGFRGETRSPTAMQNRVELDLEYIRTRSLATDILLLFKTVVSVVKGGNAY